MRKYTIKEMTELIETKLSHNFGIKPAQASDEFFYKSCALVLLDIMKERHYSFMDEAAKSGGKEIYYLSMEFLMGRSFKNTLYNLGLEKVMSQTLDKMGVRLERLYELEPDPGLGNGGLGRLAACFLDGLTTGNYPARGYCIKYDYGIFRQKLVEGWQTEMPEFWLPGGGVWLKARPEYAVDVKFDGRVKEWWDGPFHHVEQEDCSVVRAVPYDMMVAGKDGRAVNILRLWSAEAQGGIDMALFNQGEYVKAMERNAMAEVISKVLYPEDNHMEGKSLRLRQQYFLVSASIQDILRRHLGKYNTLNNLPEKVAIHINDTHPALSIPELMRFFLDECGYTWDAAWDLVTRTTAYTNHTVMREALECWQVDLFKSRLPRIYQIVTEIDNRFRYQVWCATGDSDYVERTAIIQGGVVRMANLCAAACHSINGVSRLHSDILKETVFQDYYKLTPEKFTNVTNGIAHRRWLCQANPLLSSYLNELIGEGYVADASQLEKLMQFADDKTATDRLAQIKRANKERLASAIQKQYDIKVSPDSIFDMQVKRLHEYKRQHLNALHIISDYLDIKNSPNKEFTPKTYIFGAKAAAGYYMAKQFIQMLWQLGKIINNDPAVRDLIKIVFMENYNVTLAEMMMPAAEISEQISLAGTEASGTGNMKLMLNGAITLGTEDGANVEIHEAVGDDNIIIFGMRTEEVSHLQATGYHPAGYYYNNPQLKAAVENISQGAFSDIARILTSTDQYMALADFADYCKAQETASALWRDADRWNRMSLVNIAKAGRFAADRAIADYARDIWHTAPVPTLGVKKGGAQK